MKDITETDASKVLARLSWNSNIYLESKVSSATIGRLNTLQVVNLKENVTVLASPQNERQKGLISLIMPKFH